MSNVLPSLTPKEVCAALERMGFTCYRKRGSHRIYVQGERQVVVPFHTKDLKKSTLHQIIKGTGLSAVEFVTFL